MVLIGRKEEWHFCFSSRRCSYKNCMSEGIVCERFSGIILCEEHANFHKKCLEDARKFIPIENINNSDVQNTEKKHDLLDNLMKEYGL